jgi:hypothetical protein
VFLYPSATDNRLGSEKFGLGPTAVLLQQRTGWTYGLLTNHIIQFTFGTRYYVDRPARDSDWGTRFAVTLLFPR